MRKHVSPATVISLVALFFSLSGAGLAASHYLITSTKQIAPSVRLALKGDRGPSGQAGVTGATGAAGSQGQQGTAGTFSSVTTSVAYGPTVAMCATGSSSCAASVASCPAGTTAISGGMADVGRAPNATLNYDQPYGNGWEIVMTNHGGTLVDFRAVALCAS
jgi:hypothetical protein